MHSQAFSGALRSDSLPSAEASPSGPARSDGSCAARIVKAPQASQLKELSSFDFQTIAARCQQHVEWARTTAAEVLARAADEAEAIREQSTKLGFEAGRQAGLEAARSEIHEQVEQRAEQLTKGRMDQVLPAIDRIIAAIESEREQWLSAWEEAAIGVCTAMAERIIQRQIEIDPSLTSSRIASVLELAAGSPRVQIRLHPTDIQKLGEQADEIVRRMSRCSDCEITADTAIQPGGCLVETSHGQIDARLETQLNRIRDELLG